MYAPPPLLFSPFVDLPMTLHVVSREALEELYVQYANLSPQLNDVDVVEIGLTKPVFQKIIQRICQWRYEEYFMNRLFIFFDSNRNKHVDFKELICGLSGVLSSPSPLPIAPPHHPSPAPPHRCSNILLVLIKGTNEEKLKSMHLPSPPPLLLSSPALLFFISLTNNL